MRKIKRLIGLLVLVAMAAAAIFFGSSFKDKASEVKNDILAQVSKIYSTEAEDVYTSEAEDICGPYAVVRVIDGDTLLVNIDGAEERVRLIGVDTPESVSSNESKNCAEGKIASNYTKSMLGGKMIYLSYDEGKYDKYDRILAYVFTEDMEMYNLHLIQKGYAQTMTIEPNTKYAEKFAEAQRIAKESEIGFWASGYTCWD